jgi:hypothetical protein
VRHIRPKREILPAISEERVGATHLLESSPFSEEGGQMHAVVVTVTISDREAAESHLRETVVPGVSQSPGFVAGYWTRKDDAGLAMVVFESEDAAKAMSERVPSMVPDVVTLGDVEVREVVAHA